MAYVAPSVVDFKARFPEFVASDDTGIQFAIDEALRYVDDGWIEGDYAIAVLYLAAHFFQLSVNAAGGGDEGDLTSERLGQIAFSYSTTSSATRTSNLTTTDYGKRYDDLLRRNIPGVLVV